MSLTAYGAGYPAPAIDPADYAHRTMITGSAVREDAPTLVCWLDRDPMPLDDDMIDSVINVLANEGGALFMARDPDVLNRVVTFVRGVIRRQAGGEPECVVA